MTRIGSYSGEEVVRAFKRSGWHVARRKGSHVIMEKEGFDATPSIPVHKGKDVKKGTLRNLIRDAELSVEECLKVIK
ncbi:MAG: type II toxin-antitoxin system HicA family toxin [Deltaproteobacteria bacterium]|nr:type II toxin-antitoxin system HicA family toxin [Deltaproteobacteria bacterium]